MHADFFNLVNNFNRYIVCSKLSDVLLWLILNKCSQLKNIVLFRNMRGEIFAKEL